MNESPTCDSATFTAEDRRFVYAVARRIVRDEDAAADVTQDALLLAFRYRDRFRGDARYRTWLYKIAASAAITHLRRRRRRRTDRMVSLGAVADACAPGQNPEEHLACAEVAARTAAELAALDERYGDVLRLRFVDGLSEAEVADVLGVSLPTVKIRTHRGRQALRAAVDA
ncbi:MAG: sigma-70 family RNA polymerase sigma factor [Deltaproteobacteria bacterium]|nr:sigma-70 family RNA polymerase sigma factor [Kofleriaceae bacterium]